MSKKQRNSLIFSLIIILIVSVLAYYKDDIDNLIYKVIPKEEITQSYNIEEIPEYTGNDYVIINDNKPTFTEEEYITTSFENYSDLDYLGRARTAFANVSKETMPTEKRGSIGMIKPSGWHTVKYDIVDKYIKC